MAQNGPTGGVIYLVRGLRMFTTPQTHLGASNARTAALWRAQASCLGSNEALSELLAEMSRVLTTVEAVDQARVEAGLQISRRLTIFSARVRKPGCIWIVGSCL